MITFLLEEGVITVGTLSGIFTTGMLNSLKNNIVEPCIEKMFPSQKFEESYEQPQVPPPSQNSEKSKFGDIFPMYNSPPSKPGTKKDTIQWGLFFKDFITWLLVMFILYIFWKKIIIPIKMSKTGN